MSQRKNDSELIGINHNKKAFPIYFLLVGGLIFSAFFVLKESILFAQSKAVEVNYVYDIADKNAQDGDILITSTQGLIRANIPYDSRIFGVIQDQPVLVYRKVDNTGRPVSRYGIAQVNVTNLNGPIAPGDYITSSDIAGKGQKATQSGYVIGVALTSLDESTAERIDYTSPFNPDITRQVLLGKVTVALRIEYAELSTSRSILRFFENFNTALLRNAQDPEQFFNVVRYIIAGLVILISFTISFFSFSRSIPKSIEAIGRNPLAQRAILFAIILNVSFTVLTVTLGLVIAIIVLRT